MSFNISLFKTPSSSTTSSPVPISHEIKSDKDKFVEIKLKSDSQVIKIDNEDQKINTPATPQRRSGHSRILGFYAMDTGNPARVAQKRRHQKMNRDNILGITKPAIRRLARRAGVKRISNGVYPEVRVTLKSYLQRVIMDSILYAENSHRKTLLAIDIVHALKKQGKTLYSF
ncbi:Histone H4 [Nowakowskiella sp. JEL0407]|nr:Histone H4 [Nowakowskiella sp. JEL0407]